MAKRKNQVRRNRAQRAFDTLQALLNLMNELERLHETADAKLLKVLNRLGDDLEKLALLGFGQQNEVLVRAFRSEVKDFPTILRGMGADMGAELLEAALRAIDEFLEESTAG